MTMEDKLRNALYWHGADFLQWKQLRFWYKPWTWFGDYGKWVPTKQK